MNHDAKTERTPTPVKTGLSHELEGRLLRFARDEDQGRNISDAARQIIQQKGFDPALFSPVHQMMHHEGISVVRELLEGDNDPIELYKNMFGCRPFGYNL